MKPALFFLFTVLTLAAQSTTEHLPEPTENIADALRAARLLSESVIRQMAQSMRFEGTKWANLIEK